MSAQEGRFHGMLRQRFCTYDTQRLNVRAFTERSEAKRNVVIVIFAYFLWCFFCWRIFAGVSLPLIGGRIVLMVSVGGTVRCANILIISSVCTAAGTLIQGRDTWVSIIDRGINMVIARGIDRVLDRVLDRVILDMVLNRVVLDRVIDRGVLDWSPTGGRR